MAVLDAGEDIIQDFFPLHNTTFRNHFTDVWQQAGLHLYGTQLKWSLVERLYLWFIRQWNDPFTPWSLIMDRIKVLASGVTMLLSEAPPQSQTGD